MTHECAWCFMRFAKVKWISLNNNIIHFVNIVGIAFTHLGRLCTQKIILIRVTAWISLIVKMFTDSKYYYLPLHLN